MPQEDFSTARQGYESWPWMYGYQYAAIRDKVASQGINAALPEILLLSDWCSVYMTQEEREAIQENPKTRWEDLHEIINICQAVAYRKKSWDYPDEEEELTVPGNRTETHQEPK